jgi:uncharacterized protein YjhX (UPF0386 family)
METGKLPASGATFQRPKVLKALRGIHSLKPPGKIKRRTLQGAMDAWRFFSYYHHIQKGVDIQVFNILSKKTSMSSQLYKSYKSYIALSAFQSVTQT